MRTRAVTAVILLTFGMSTEEHLLVSYVRDTVLGVVAGAPAFVPRGGRVRAAA